MEIFLTNTPSGKKEVFIPLEKGKVGIYTCGLTVYNYAHIGNLRAYVFSDILRRTLEFNGYKVKHVMNITDVGHLTDDADEGEDKLEKGAKREKKTPLEIARFYEAEFIKDLKMMNILIPQIMPRATEHVEEMIELVKKLQDKGFTYSAGGNVYFDTSKFNGYRDLAKLEKDPEKQISRVEKDTFKKHPFDFVLWFTRYKYDKHSMLWDSPWGGGFPGWHIECSAMASKYLGERIDIHTGGIDHIPVHHTNEIAQSECAFGHRWVNYWLHSDWLVVGEGEKMAKSKENFLRLKTLTDAGYDALDYRYFLLGAHYRKQLEFTYEALDGARNALKKIRNRAGELIKSYGDCFPEEPESEYIDDFTREVNDDLNTPRALAVMWEALSDNSLKEAEKLSLLRKFDKVLGLDVFASGDVKIPVEIEELIRKRETARKSRDFITADQLRKDIESRGYEVLDGKDGTKVRKS
ncbi:cysteine--tRNA ligase [candidate division WOR-3 bacterium]|nr:cysteine--tRNA ligase [candidate division WOR-3 bacterium]